MSSKLDMKTTILSLLIIALISASCDPKAKFRNRIAADIETEPVASDKDADAADDPAFWFNRADPAKSLVLGTDKKAGIYLYDLEGKICQFVNAGRINNVDLRDGFPWDGKEVVLVAGSNRSNNCISLFTLDNQGRMTDALLQVPSGVDEVYGLCMYRSLPEGAFYVFVNGKGGMLEQWHITGTKEGLHAGLERSLMLGSQPEGMVAHDNLGIVYLGVEEEGIYRLDEDTGSSAAVGALPSNQPPGASAAWRILPRSSSSCLVA